MTDWRALFAKGDCNGIENIMQWLKPLDQAELLAAIKKAVPMITEENGMERRERHASPREVPEELKGAAKILYFGELEARVSGEPPGDIEIWAEVRSAAEEELRQFAAADEVTKGDATLSRQKHAQDALEFLQTMDISFSWARCQIDDDDERAWFDEAVASVAWQTFNAGRHYEVARYKWIESSAVRGEKVAGGQRNSAHLTNARHEEPREKRFKRMRELMPTVGVKSAAAQCEVEGLGTMGAIKRQWYRHQKKSAS